VLAEQRRTLQVLKRPEQQRIQTDINGFEAGKTKGSKGFSDPFYPSQSAVSISSALHQQPVGS
jgi:hypothetical protein